jgi:hypothetical protein
MKVKPSSPRVSAAIDLCDMTVKCRCRWRWTSDGLCLKCHDKLQLRGCGLSSTLLFFLSSLLLFTALGILFAWLAFPPFQHRPLDGKGIAGCQPDNEGSWAIGVYSGKSPFSLEPLEMVLLIFLFCPLSEATRCLLLCCLHRHSHSHVQVQLHPLHHR